MLLVYELCVMVPSLPFMVVIAALAVFVFGLWIFEGGSTSPYWTSGLNGFLIMLGGALLADQGLYAGQDGRSRLADYHGNCLRQLRACGIGDGPG